MRIVILAGVCALLVNACTTVPEQIQGEYSGLTPARADSAQVGNAVRWGGVHPQDQPQPATDLFRSTFPRTRQVPAAQARGWHGRAFHGVHRRVYDPVVFTRGREVTMTGTLREITYQPLENFNYRYPVLDVDELVLWQKRQKVLVYNHYGSPWYGGYWGYPYRGYYGWYGYPYRHRTTVGEMTLLPDAADVTPQPSPLRPVEQRK